MKKSQIVWAFVFSFLFFVAYASSAEATATMWFANYSNPVGSTIRTTPNYGNLFGGPAPSSWDTADQQGGIIPASGTISDFHVRLQTPMNAGHSYVITARINRTNTLMRCTISNPATAPWTTSSCDYTGAPITVTQGQYASIGVLPDALTTVHTPIAFYLNYNSDTPGESVYGMTGNPATDEPIGYNQMYGAAHAAPFERDRYSVSPTSGVLRDLCINLRTNVGVGNARNFYASINGSVTNTISVHFDSTDGTIKCSTGTIAINAGDRIAFWNGNNTGTPAGSWVNYGLGIIPTNPSDFVIHNRIAFPANGAGPFYYPIGMGIGSTVESAIAQIFPSGLNLKAFYLQSTDTAGAGRSFDVQFRENGAPANPTYEVNLSGGMAKTGSVIAPFITVAGNTYNFITTQTGPTTQTLAVTSFLASATDSIPILPPNIPSTVPSVTFNLILSSPNATDTLAPQIEIRDIATPFTNTSTNTGTAVAYAGTPVNGLVTVSNLTKGVTYHFQASVSNSVGSSSWIDGGQFVFSQ